MKGSTKWIFVYLVIALCLILSTHSQPTKEGLLVKRVEKSDVNELHQATLTRSESSTATTKGSTPTATSTHPGNGNGSDNGSMPAIIQAENAGWWSKYILVICKC
jgi:hypothetical protein